MRTYHYKGFNPAGGIQRGFVEAASIKSAREMLAARGILAERVSVSGPPPRFSRERRAILYRELSELLAAGVPLERALNILIEAPDSGTQSVQLVSVRNRIREGMPLAEAFRRIGRSVTDYEVAIMVAAQETAAMPAMLKNLADFLDAQNALQARVRAALIYPAFVAVTGVVVAAAMLTLLVPRAQEILAAGNIPVPAVTRAALGLGKFAVSFGPALAGVVVMLAVWVVFRLRRDRAFAIQWARGLLKIPVLRRGISLLVNLRFCHTFSVLLDGGVSIVKALPLAGRATGNAWVESLLLEITESVRHGDKLSRCIQRVPPLGGQLPGLISIGEESGDISALVRTAGQQADQQWNRYVSSTLALLEPVLILLIGGFVLFVTLSVLLPVISLTKAVG